MGSISERKFWGGVQQPSKMLEREQTEDATCSAGSEVSKKAEQAKANPCPSTKRTRSHADSRD